MNRRGFLRSTAALGSGLAAASTSQAQPAAGPSGELNVAVIGAGTQGQALLAACMSIEGLRFKALCDIWTAYNQKEVSKQLADAGQEHNVYADYREMLAKEKDLHAVIVATPDSAHAEQTVACLKAGLHVYCESPMSNTLDGARRMVAAARESGKLLQIGNQRRSNPKYIHCRENLLKQVNLLGRITAVNGQWNRSVQPDRGFPRRFPVEDAALAQHGYKTMPRFRNWRWFKDLSLGALADFGTHQIDVYNWYLGAAPKAVLATGGVDFFDKKTHETPDTVVAALEYDTPQGSVRAHYQAVSANGNLGYYEKFLGSEGALVISEASAGLVNLFREANAPDWDRWVGLDLLVRLDKKADDGTTPAVVSVVESIQPARYAIPLKFEDPVHKPHIENFFNAVRGKGALNCPADVAFQTAVTIFKIAEAIETGKKIELTPEDFKA